MLQALGGRSAHQRCRGHADECDRDEQRLMVELGFRSNRELGSPRKSGLLAATTSVARRLWSSRVRRLGPKLVAARDPSDRALVEGRTADEADSRSPICALSHKGRDDVECAPGARWCARNATVHGGERSGRVHSLFCQWDRLGKARAERHLVEPPSRWRLARELIAAWADARPWALKVARTSLSCWSSSVVSV
jgi:hypothetical protein